MSLSKHACSLVLNISEELGVEKSVLMLVLVHIHHKAYGAANDEGQKEGDPIEGLNSNHVSNLGIGGKLVGRIRGTYGVRASGKHRGC